MKSFYIIWGIENNIKNLFINYLIVFNWILLKICDQIYYIVFRFDHYDYNDYFIILIIFFYF